MVIVYGIGFVLAFLVLIRRKQHRKAAAVMIVGCIAAFMMELYGGLLSEEEYLSGVWRDKKSGKKKYIEVTAAVSDGTENFILEIAPQAYEPDELQRLWGEARSKIDEILFSDGCSADHVDRDLTLPGYIEGMPFVLQWESSDPLLISQEGRLGDRIGKNGELVMLTVTGRVDDSDFSVREEFLLKVFPERTRQAFFERLGNRISEMESGSRGSPWYALPESFEGQLIKWKKKKDNTSVSIFFLACISAIVIVVAKRQEEEKERKKKMEQLEKEYPELASRMVMLMGAGMTVSGAFRKMAGDYRSRKKEIKRLIYEEAAVTCHELDSGISEVKAYQNMSVRCRLPCYARFASLLIQCVKRGSGGCREALQEEAAQALRDRKALAKRLGEEAGTKLLLPMTLMLIVVMAIIMVPAFTSFTF